MDTLKQSGALVAALTVLTATLVWYLRLVSQSLTGPNNRNEVLTDEELKSRRNAWKGINMLNSIPNVATGEGYVVIGGSGMVGSAIVELLLLRKEKNIRIIDIMPPRSRELSQHPSVTFLKADITSSASLREALLAPFPSTGKPPSVVYLTAIIVRFWERALYCKDASWPVNVTGTRNVLDAVAQLPGEPILVYTSTGELSVEAPNHWSLSGPDHKQKVYSDDTVAKSYEQRRWYTKSKFAAEQLILEADKKSTRVRHGIIRPGYHIIGHRDLVVDPLLRMSTVPSIAGDWAHNCIVAWDAAAALLLMESALRERPNEVRGTTFLVTGKDQPWCYDKLRRTSKKAAGQPIKMVTLPPLTMLLIAHAVEALLYARFYVLQLLCAVGVVRKPSVSPSWIGQTLFLQPSTFNNFFEFKLDDARARNVLGYRPQWGNAECAFEVDERISREEVPLK